MRISGVVFLLLFVSLLCSSANVRGQSTTRPRVYIPVGHPNLKKVLLAVEPTIGPSAFARSFNSTFLSDMVFSDLFVTLPAARLPKAGGMALGSFDLKPYRAMGVEFLLKSKVTVGSNGSLEAELRLYDVVRGTQILGKRYPFLSKSKQPAQELAHFSANEVIELLTGEKGIFRTRILMSCGFKRKEIFIMDFDGNNLTQLTNDGNFALSPSWAPDGQRVVFTSYKPAGKRGMLNPNLYVYNITTNKRSLITSARGVNSGAVFHPTENKLAYTFSNQGKPEIFVLNLDNRTRVPITRTHFFTVEPDWSPDGQRLAFSSSKTGRPHIYVSNADGSAAKQLTKVGVYNSSPRWSPTGDRLVFSGQENKANNFNVFTIDPNGSNLMRLTDGNKSSENPVFSPNGRHIAFSSNREGRYRVYVMNQDGTNIRPISPTKLGDCKQPAWSPRL